MRGTDQDRARQTAIVFPGMRRLRVLTRSFSIAAITAVYWTCLLAALVVLLPFPDARRRARRAIFRSWSRTFLRILKVQIEVTGERPPEPVLLISNHLSYLDIMVLATEVPARFVAKAEIRGWPVAGWICRSASTIFIDRDLRRDVVRAGALIRHAIDGNDSVVLFPEGTSTHGHRVAEFKTALLAPAAAAQLAVYTSTIGYSTNGNDPPAHDAVCWWGGAPFAPHFLHLLTLDAVSARLAFGDTEHRHADRKQLAQLLHSDVVSRFLPVVDHDPADPWATPSS